MEGEIEGGKQAGREGRKEERERKEGRERGWKKDSGWGGMEGWRRKGVTNEQRLDLSHSTQIYSLCHQSSRYS